jgi:hypothetical protein
MTKLHRIRPGFYRWGDVFIQRLDGNRWPKFLWVAASPTIPPHWLAGGYTLEEVVAALE